MNVADINPLAHRSSEYGVDDLFLRRWSPRAMSGEAIPREQLMRLFEAAKWAPSSYNGQPWRFVYATRDSDRWDAFFDLMVEFNRSWCKNAAALVVICARTTFEWNGKPAETHAFDAGAAWMSLALQGARDGLVVHGMQGFDYDRAATVVGLPDEHAVLAMCAIGRPGDVDDLPEGAREKEAVNDRKPLGEVVFEGRFPG